jgi:predicted NBD/HSP70 family sugar kinase
MDPGSTIEAIHKAVMGALSSAGVPAGSVVAVGIAIGGVVDAESGTCRLSPTFGWRDVDLAKPISESLGSPVVLENDANALAATEQWFGAGRGVENFVVLAVGSGVGAGIVVNGQLHRGANGASGEIGHLRLTEKGPLCSCGARGCVEAWACDQAILRDVKAAVARGEKTLLSASHALTIADIAAAAGQGDRLSRRVLKRAGQCLGRGAAALINVIDPSLVIISGEGVEAGEWRFGATKKAIRALAFANIVPEIIVQPPPIDGSVWARGAACVVLGEIFNPPIKRSLIDII